jgi:hypothetical protein
MVMVMVMLMPMVVTDWSLTGSGKGLAVDDDAIVEEVYLSSISE